MKPPGSGLGLSLQGSCARFASIVLKTDAADPLMLETQSGEQQDKNCPNFVNIHVKTGVISVTCFCRGFCYRCLL